MKLALLSDGPLLLLASLLACAVGTPGGHALPHPAPDISTSCTAFVLDPVGAKPPRLGCLNPCPADECETWEHQGGTLGESCTCRKTLQINCCDVYLDATGGVEANGSCGPPSCWGSSRSKCMLKTSLVSIDGVLHYRDEPDCVAP